MRGIGRGVLATLFLLPIVPLGSQQTALSVESLLPRLYAYARQYRNDLPSLACDESITSQAVKKGRVRKEVKIESTLREVRTSEDPDTFSETHKFNTVDGHPPLPPLNLPFFVQGGFANGLGFKTEESLRCFDYNVVPQAGGMLRFEIVLRSNNTENVCHEAPEGYRKTLLIDEAGRIVYIERTISADAAKHRKEVYFVSMEYGPQKMGEETLWLPTKMSAHDANDERRMFVTYSNYHRYTAKSTILPVDTPPAEK